MVRSPWLQPGESNHKNIGCVAALTAVHGQDQAGGAADSFHELIQFKAGALKMTKAASQPGTLFVFDTTLKGGASDDAPASLTSLRDEMKPSNTSG